MKTNLILFRNDLRIHDNEALYEASRADRLIPVYLFDPDRYSETEYGFPRVGPHRIRFLLETIHNLRKNLRERNSDLIVRTGSSEEIIPQLIKEFDVASVFLHSEATSEEIRDELNLKRALDTEGVALQKFWGSTLYHIDNLPMSRDQVPDVFTDFRKKLEKRSLVQGVIQMPEMLPPCPVSEPGEIPSMKDLMVMPNHFVWSEQILKGTDKAVMKFMGGEDAALERVQEYIWDGDHLKKYKETRNGLLGADYSSKFSPWLTLGALSPRFVYNQVRRYEKERVSNNSTYWMIFELIWRDYFRFVFMKHGDALFKREGIRKSPHPVVWQRNDDIVRSWAEAKTGIPFVDANMKELLLTGFMSNRGRQNVASYFSWDLTQEWRIGAAWFEALLLDYDPCSNWGNWAYNSGVGNDPRQRSFNVLSQADRYDKGGDFVKHWLPELSMLPAEYVHQPNKMSAEDQQKYELEKVYKV